MDLDAARSQARTLLHTYGLKDWELTFDRATRRFGRCIFSTKVISLSGPLVAVNDEVEVRDTILHEIAHALAGSRAKHGRRWKAMAKAMGATPQRCCDSRRVKTPETERIRAGGNGTLLGSDSAPRGPQHVPDAPGDAAGGADGTAPGATPEQRHPSSDKGT